MRLLLIDFRDSYTPLLSHVLRGAGATAVDILPIDSPQLKELLPSLLDGTENYQLVVLSAGSGTTTVLLDDPLMKDLLRLPLPMWGIGLGHQLIAAHAGAHIVQLPAPHHGVPETMTHDMGGMWEGIPPRAAVARFHSWAVTEPLPADLKVTAVEPDGTVLAFAGTCAGIPRWGTQFQPESIDSSSGEEVACNIIGMARSWQQEGIAGLTTVQVIEVLREFQHDSEHLRCLDDSLAELAGMASRDSQWGSIIALCGARRIVGDETAWAQLEEELSATRKEPSVTGALGVSGWVGVVNYEADYIDFAHTEVTVIGSPQGWRVAGEDASRVEQVTEALRTAAESAAAQVAAAQAAANAATNATTAATPEDLAIATSTAVFGPDQDTYGNLFEQSQAALTSGDSFEVCLTDLFHIPRQAALTPWESFQRMRQICPTHFGSFVELPASEQYPAKRTIVSASPELFLKKERNGLVKTRPMKGTTPRYLDDLDKDAAVAEELATSPKTRAENLMAIDLARSDFAKVCEPGTVQVPRDRVVESFATVHQLVSEVWAMLAPGKKVSDAIQACLPQASMTGAPKEQTVELLEELEQQRRDIYSGALGFIADTGEAEFSVLIRTAIFDKEEIKVGAGGAIVKDSRMEGEFAELHHKASYVVQACVDDKAVQDNYPVVDSFYLSDGQVHGVSADEFARELHRNRFVESVRQLFGNGQAEQANDFFTQCLAELPGTGEYFPRIAWEKGAGSAQLTRPCPPRLTSITAVTSNDLPEGELREIVAQGDPRYFSSIKGPDLPLLGHMRSLAQELGADEIIFADRWGHVLEGSHSAILWWEGDVLCGPPKGAVLRSTMRELYEQEMAQQGFQVMEKWLPVTELPQYCVVSVNALHGVRTVNKWACR